MLLNKETIREQARFHRDRLAVDQMDFERVINAFMSGFKPQKEDVIALYWPSGKEFNTRFLIDELVKQEFQCALPCVEKGSRIFSFKTWKPDDPLEKGAYGIYEPVEGEAVEPNVFICPLLAFDRYGYRMGQGGGYYDATIAHYRAQKDITAIGVGYGQQAVLFNLPIEEHDQKMDYVLTPEGMIDHRKLD